MRLGCRAKWHCTSYGFNQGARENNGFSIPTYWHSSTTNDLCFEIDFARPMTSSIIDFCSPMRYSILKLNLFLIKNPEIFFSIFKLYSTKTFIRLLYFFITYFFPFATINITHSSKRERNFQSTTGQHFCTHTQVVSMAMAYLGMALVHMVYLWPQKCNRYDF